MHFAFPLALGYVPRSRPAQGRSTKIISIIKWIRTSRLSMKNSLPVAHGVSSVTRLHIWKQSAFVDNSAADLPHSAFKGQREISSLTTY